jgi:hypothetical protein
MGFKVMGKAVTINKVLPNRLVAAKVGADLASSQ